MTHKVNKILVPINGDKAGEEAFRLACDLSKESKSQVRVLYVIEVGQDLPLDAEVDAARGEAILNHIEAVGQEEKCHVKAEYIQARHAGPAIVQEALDRDSQMIVMGIPYKRRLGSFALGYTASHILKHAPCQVVIVREQPGENGHG